MIYPSKTSFLLDINGYLQTKRQIIFNSNHFANVGKMVTIESSTRKFDKSSFSRLNPC